MTTELDASSLALKYGEPVAQDTFKVRPNLEMVVKYGPSGQVCRIEFASVTRQQVDEVIDELVPPEVRGKETGHSLWILGGHSRSWVFYEHVAICKCDGGPDGVTVIFKRAECR